jgi:hypothetical protein
VIGFDQREGGTMVDKEWVIKTNIPDIEFGVYAETKDDALDIAEVVLTECVIKSVTYVGDVE